jgi:thioredoxin
MKRTILIAVMLFASTLCGIAQNKEQKSPVKSLTYKEFVKSIWNFEKNPDTFIYKGKLPAVIDFYADWCGPCRKVGPIMEKMAEQYAGKLNVYKVNVDQEKDLATVFQVRSIPMVLFIPKEGQPMMQTGALPEAEYIRIVEEKLLK